MIQGQVNALRQAVISLELRGINGQPEITDAVVDTGFNDFLTLPPNLATRLQLPFLENRLYELGDGNLVEFAVHRLTIVWDGQERDIEALVTEGGVLTGMRLLQGFTLFMDVVDGGEVRIERRP